MYSARTPKQRGGDCCCWLYITQLTCAVGTVLLRVWSIAKLNIKVYLDTNKHNYELIINCFYETTSTCFFCGLTSTLHVYLILLSMPSRKLEASLITGGIYQ